MNEGIENKVTENINRYFPDYNFSLMGDPEDESVQFIRLYDVADEDVNEFKNRLWDVIEEHLEVEGISFVPSIVSHSNTAKFYSEFLRTPSRNLTCDSEFGLIEDVIRMIEENEISVTASRFDFGEDLIQSDYRPVRICGSEIGAIMAFEDGGCGYAGEKCRLAA